MYTDYSIQNPIKYLRLSSLLDAWQGSEYASGLNKGIYSGKYSGMDQVKFWPKHKKIEVFGRKENYGFGHIYWRSLFFVQCVRQVLKNLK